LVGLPVIPIKTYKITKMFFRIEISGGVLVDLF
jgi:hypothetical protein